MDIQAQARKTLERFEEIEAQLQSPSLAGDRTKLAEMSRLHKSLQEAVDKSRQYLGMLGEKKEWESAAAGSDAEMRDMAREELERIAEALPELETELKFLFIPKDPNDQRNCVLEIRAGTGGDEASLFAGDLFRMYKAYAEQQRWRVTLVSASEGTVGGFKEVIAEIEGEGAYGVLKYESGVHRVQRVPDTETQGRVHTSAATVVIMPLVEDEGEIEIRDEDLRVDTYRAGGAGGQHINKTDSAVRITHLPSGLVVACQDERSQHKNRAKAMQLLQSKLLDLQIAERESKESAERKSQVGTGDRSAKIRTYNFPQGRLTDHRIGLTLYRLESVMQGDIQEIIDALAMEANAEKLKALERAG